MTSIAPEILEACWGQSGVSGRMLNRNVAKPILYGSRVDTVVRQLVTAAMPQHVKVDRQWQLGARSQRFDQPVKSARRERCAAFARKDIAAIGIQLAKRRQHPQFVASDRMHSILTAFGAANVKR